MYHSITIGDKNTWDDWHLIPATRPLFNPPTVKENMVNIPGGDGVLDLTASLAGRPTYNNQPVPGLSMCRTGSRIGPCCIVKSWSISTGRPSRRFWRMILRISMKGGFRQSVEIR